MGTYVNGVYVPTLAESGWDEELNDFLTRSGQEHINPKLAPYGAVGDATVANYTTTATDDTVALQAALDAAAGGICYLPGPACRTTGTLTIPSGTTFQGVGGGADAFDQGAQLLVDITDGSPALLVEGGSANVTIKDMRISCGASAGEMVLLDGDSGHTITHTTIDNVTGGGGNTSHFGINGTWALETLITGCHFDGLGGGAVHLGDTCNASVIRDNAFSNGGGAGAIGGILIECDGVLVEGNVVEAFNGAYGIKLNGCSEANVIRNWFEDDDGICIWVTGLSHNITVLGNNMAAFGVPQMKVESCRNIYIAQNVFTGTLVLTSTATVNQQTLAVLAANNIDQVDTSGLLNARDIVLRMADLRANDVLSALEIVVGNQRLINTSQLQWAPSANVAADTTIRRWAAGTVYTESMLVTGYAHGSLPAPGGYNQGTQVYCTSDKKPVWSDGSAHWVDAAGANHT